MYVHPGAAHRGLQDRPTLHLRNFPGPCEPWKYLEVPLPERPVRPELAARDPAGALPGVSRAVEPLRAQTEHTESCEGPPNHSGHTEHIQSIRGHGSSAGTQSHEGPPNHSGHREHVQSTHRASGAIEALRAHTQHTQSTHRAHTEPSGTMEPLRAHRAPTEHEQNGRSRPALPPPRLLTQGSQRLAPHGAPSPPPSRRSRLGANRESSNSGPSAGSIAAAAAGPARRRGRSSVTAHRKGSASSNELSCSPAPWYVNRVIVAVLCQRVVLVAVHRVRGMCFGNFPI